jgi:hypothetical protein
LCCQAHEGCFTPSWTHWCRPSGEALRRGALRLFDRFREACRTVQASAVRSRTLRADETSGALRHILPRNALHASQGRSNSQRPDIPRRTAQPAQPAEEGWPLLPWRSSANGLDRHLAARNCPGGQRPHATVPARRETRCRQRPLISRGDIGQHDGHGVGSHPTMGGSSFLLSD